MESTLTTPAWLDATAYPFTSRYFETGAGKLHYVDEGAGEVLLFVHGTPSWSFLYRHYLAALSQSYRCIAVDHLGFGLSDKPEAFAGTPEAHSQNLQRLIDHLGLQNITLVVHDFGGPIGLGYAVTHPANIQRIVLFNTWLWATASDKGTQKINQLLHSALGKFLYLRTNFSPKVLLKQAFYQKKHLSKPIHRQYQAPFPNPASRHGLLKIGQSLVGSSAWYQQQWEQIDTLSDKPLLILWGMKDAFIQPNYLERWEAQFPQAQVHQYQAGHFVQEECPTESLAALRGWLMD